jgi:hypothetical protein
LAKCRFVTPWTSCNLKIHILFDFLKHFYLKSVPITKIVGGVGNGCVIFFPWNMIVPTGGIVGVSMTAATLVWVMAPALG